MAGPEAEHIFGIQLRESANDGSDFSNGDTDYRVVFLGEDGSLHAKDSAGTVTNLSGGGGATFAGKVLLATAGNIGLSAVSGGFGWANNEAHIWPILIPGAMLVQSASFDMSVAASGTYQWGLYDFSSSLTSMTELATGSGALNSTGWQTITATGAPVTVAAGSYLFIAKAPSSNTGEMRYTTENTIPGACKNQTGYTWDTTPNATTGWSNIGGVYRAVLNGRLDASTQWG